VVLVLSLKIPTKIKILKIFINKNNVLLNHKEKEHFKKIILKEYNIK